MREALGLLALVAVGYALTASDTAAAAVPDSDPAGSGGGLLDSIMGTLGMKATRGERNNNPGNIRLSSASWQGQVAGDDSQFATFAAPADGLRALAKLLRNYQDLYGLRTVRGLVTRWAPASENNTAAYVAAVAADMGVGPDDPLNLGNPATLQSLVTGIVHHENGRVIYSQADIAAAVARA